MIWYLAGGVIGILFFKKKYHLSIWSAIGYGINLTLCVYFGIAAISAFVVSSTIQDDLPNPWVFASLFIVFLVAFVHNINRLRYINSVSNTHTSSETESDAYNNDAKPNDGRKFQKCPYCAEYVLEEAIYCRFCHRELNSSIFSSNNRTHKKNEFVEVKENTNRTGNGSIYPVIAVIGIGIMIVIFFSKENYKTKLSISPSPTFGVTPTQATEKCFLKRDGQTFQLEFTGEYASFVCRRIRSDDKKMYKVDNPMDANIICSYEDQNISAVVRDVIDDSSNSLGICNVLKEISMNEDLYFQDLPIFPEYQNLNTPYP